MDPALQKNKYVAPRTTVVDHLTSGEHRSAMSIEDMHIEEARLATFQTWTKAFITKENLALFGFYHCGPDDNVRCAFCKVEIGSWEVGDNVLHEHLRWSPNCPLIKRKGTINRPIDEVHFERSLPSSVSVDTVGIRFPIEHSPNSYSKNDFLKSEKRKSLHGLSRQIIIPSRPAMSIKQMHIEEARLATFQTWTIAFIAKENLALYGFYHCGINDHVRCAFCKVEIGNWEVGDNVLREHLNWSPNCPLINRKRTLNQPIDEVHFERSLPPVSVDTVGIRFPIEHRPNSYPENEFLETQTSSAVNHPDYRKISDRLKSFEEWPKSMRQKPAELSDAGLFYTGRGDRVICFSCGGELKDWNENDVPWEQHAMRYDKCAYLNQVKPSNYIESVKQKFKTKDEHTSGFLNKGTDINDPKLCKICWDKEMNAILFPCMHIIACVTCAFLLALCPVCRKPISEVKKVYFS